MTGTHPALNLSLLFRDSVVPTSPAEYSVRRIDEAPRAERANPGARRAGHARAYGTREAAYGATRDSGTASPRSFATSRPGASPNSRAYSRLNCDALT